MQIKYQILAFPETSLYLPVGQFLASGKGFCIARA